VSLSINDKVLQWVPPVALVLIFILQLPLFTWVEVAPGGVPAVAQGAWGAAFGKYTQDPDLKDVFKIVTEKEIKDKKDENEVSNEPGVSLLMLFYLLPFFFLALFVTLGVAALNFIKAPLPPQVQQMLPWKWAIVAALNFIPLLFLGMQLLVNFSLESNVKARFDNTAEQTKKEKTHKEQLLADVQRGEMLESLRRTIWLCLAVALHILATLCAVLVYWVEKRGPSRPLPRLELLW
jgi:hypothetical protein